VEQLAGVPVEVGASEFLQVNRAQAAAMYARVAELAMPARRAVELFAGLGGIALSLARAGAHVVAVEIDRDAVAQLRRAAERTGLPVTALAGDAAGALELEGAFDVAVVDPPRKGFTDGALDLLARLDTPAIVYVSCGPESLGRDVRRLGERGYRVEVVEPFDLMPGTPQIETVVRLVR
jgi:23S rRNA (uracil1939-C5)-methyltransferase